jgi:DNA-binding transcriptional LysR family regulator
VGKGAHGAVPTIFESNVFTLSGGHAIERAFGRPVGFAHPTELAIKSGAGIAPLPAVYAAADKDLVCVLGPLPELNYPMYLLAHRDLRNIPRVRAVFEFCLRELNPVLMSGEMKK